MLISTTGMVFAAVGHVETQIAALLDQGARDNQAGKPKPFTVREVDLLVDGLGRVEVIGEVGPEAGERHGHDQDNDPSQPQEDEALVCHSSAFGAAAPDVEVHRVADDEAVGDGEGSYDKRVSQTSLTPSIRGESISSPARTSRVSLASSAMDTSMRASSKATYRTVNARTLTNIAISISSGIVDPSGRRD